MHNKASIGKAGRLGQKQVSLCLCLQPKKRATVSAVRVTDAIVEFYLFSVMSAAWVRSGGWVLVRGSHAWVFPPSFLF